MLKKYYIALFFIFVCNLHAHDSVAMFIYDIDFTTYFDNREYDEPYQIPQTIFNFRLSPSIGVGITDKRGGVHRLLAGVSYTQPLGGEWKNTQFDPIAFYQLITKKFTIEMGAIPYTHRIFQLPDYQMYDSIAYYHPQIQGALFQFRGTYGFIEAMCDWRGSQSTTRKEKFRVIVNGEYHRRWFIIGGLASLNHKANYAPSQPKDGVCDDIYANPYVGADFSQHTPLDTLALRMNYIFGFQRDRTVEQTRTPQGGLFEMMAKWRFVGFKNTLFFGENLMPFYRTRGNDLNQGDPFYQASFYNRTDLFFTLYKNNFVNCFFSYNLHYDKHNLSHQQQMIVKFNFNNK